MGRAFFRNNRARGDMKLGAQEMEAFGIKKALKDTAFIEKI